MNNENISFKMYIKEDVFAPSTAGGGVMGVAGATSDVKLDIPMGSSKPDAPEYRKKNKLTLVKLKEIIK